MSGPGLPRSSKFRTRLAPATNRTDSVVRVDARAPHTAGFDVTSGRLCLVGGTAAEGLDRRTNQTADEILDLSRQQGIRIAAVQTAIDTVQGIIKPLRKR
ncbi:hypothetical protein [Streptomyces mirabilis]|uniref:hypothetical protein n=1 Tax=Streptomyces mirabilis TaxID=68239 RepID=UPI0035DAC102